jgi:hypothetical protein
MYQRCVTASIIRVITALTKQYQPLKRRSTSTRLHSAVSQRLSLYYCIYLFICNLFDDTFSVRQTIVSNIRIGE